MKKLLLLVSSILITQFLFAQSNIPNVTIYNNKGKADKLENYIGKGKPVYVTFWALWCSNCIKELNAIKDEYQTWQNETGVNIIAISIDDERNKLKVMPFVNAKEWEYTVLLDPNSDLKRAYNINTIPFSILYDGKGNIIKQHNGYNAGDEIGLYEEIKKLAAITPPVNNIAPVIEEKK